MKISVIIAAAGSGSRLGKEKNKVLLDLEGKPVLGYSLCLFDSVPEISEMIIVAALGEESLCAEIAAVYCEKTPCKVVVGGKERMDSVYRGLCEVSEDCDTVMIHDGARPFLSDVVLGDLLTADFTDGAILALPVKETVKIVDGDKVSSTPQRAKLYAAQTPQIFPKKTLMRCYETALKSDFSATDDASVVEFCGGEIKIVPGDEENIKITTPKDWRTATSQRYIPMMRVGSGFDVHRLTEERALILCGVQIPHEKGLLGHSDADVAVHALMDAILGAVAMGDIGQHFPPSSSKYKDADSLVLLEQVKLIMEKKNYKIVNADITIMAERPKMAPHIKAMRENIAIALGVDIAAIGIKATTTEQLGFVGREEGIAASATVLVQYNEQEERKNNGVYC